MNSATDIVLSDICRFCISLGIVSPLEKFADKLFQIHHFCVLYQNLRRLRTVTHETRLDRCSPELQQRTNITRVFMSLAPFYCSAKFNANHAICREHTAAVSSCVVLYHKSPNSTRGKSDATTRANDFRVFFYNAPIGIKAVLASSAPRDVETSTTAPMALMPGVALRNTSMLRFMSLALTDDARLISTG